MSVASRRWVTERAPVERGIDGDDDFVNLDVAVGA